MDQWEKQGQSGGYTGFKALVKIQEPLHPELHHSTHGPSTGPRRRTTRLHSWIDNLLQTAVVTSGAIWSPPGRTYHNGGYREYEVDHFQHVHPSSQLLQYWVSIFNRISSDDTGHPYPWRFQREPSVIVLKIDRWKRKKNGRLHQQI